MTASASRPAPPQPSGADPARSERDARLATLLAASAHGDSSAYEAFYDATVAYAHALAQRVLHGVDVDDLLADAYFEAWRNAGRFDAARGSAVSWLLTIVKSRALDLLRRRAAHPSVGGSEQVGADSADPGADPAEALWRQQAGSRLHDALQGLTGAERWMLGLAYFRELTHTEIALSTGLPLGTVKSHLQRAQTKLRAALAGPRTSP